MTIVLRRLPWRYFRVTFKRYFPFSGSLARLMRMCSMQFAFGFTSRSNVGATFFQGFLA